MATTLLAIGTRKGLWLATSEDRATWSLSQPHFLMTEVPSIGIDTRDGRTRLMVGVRSEHFGPTVAHSDDLGATWTEPENGAIRLRCEAYAEARSMYDRRAWSDAAAAFQRMGREWPEDGAARVMAERCDAFQQADPGADWDGVWSATSK